MLFDVVKFLHLGLKHMCRGQCVETAPRLPTVKTYRAAPPPPRTGKLVTAALKLQSMLEKETADLAHKIQSMTEGAETLIERT